MPMLQSLFTEDLTLCQITLFSEDKHKGTKVYREQHCSFFIFVKKVFHFLPVMAQWISLQWRHPSHRCVCKCGHKARHTKIWSEYSAPHSPHHEALQTGGYWARCPIHSSTWKNNNELRLQKKPKNTLSVHYRFPHVLIDFAIKVSEKEITWSQHEQQTHWNETFGILLFGQVCDASLITEAKSRLK